MTLILSPLRGSPEVETRQRQMGPRIVVAAAVLGLIGEAPRPLLSALSCESAPVGTHKYHSLGVASLVFAKPEVCRPTGLACVLHKDSALEGARHDAALVTARPSCPNNRLSHKYGHVRATMPLHWMIAPSQLLPRHSGSEDGGWPAPGALHFGEGACSPALQVEESAMGPPRQKPPRLLFFFSLSRKLCSGPFATR